MRAFVLISGALVCCTPADRLQILDGTGQGFALVEAPRGSLHDLLHVDGSHARFSVRTELQVDGLERTGPEDRGRSADELFGERQAPRTRFTVRDGVATPEDFDTLALFTAYAHTERAMGWFESVGAGGPATSTLEVHYLPDMAGAEDAGLAQTDNAYYFVPGDAVLLLPPDTLQDIPLAMNAGVVAHELAHRVSYWEMWDAQRYETLDRFEGTYHENPGAIEALYLLAALDEGLADYHGAVVSGDPAFVGRSVDFLASSRDVSVPRTYEAAWVGSLDAYYDGDTYSPYRVGSVVASALWAAGEAVGHDRVGEAVVAAQRALTPQVLELSVEHTDLEVEIVRQLGAPPEACDAFRATYAELWDAFEEDCP